ncbi:GIY-YIG nuclease family protein [Candidatus Margulisiibacteriota bacterium]
MHYLYILQSKKTGRYYVGVTNNVQRRLKEHNSGTVKSTGYYRPWVLKKTEEYSNIKEAYRRERFIKAKHSRKIIEKIINS